MEVWNALRRLRRQPAFTMLAVLSLAVGLGALLAVFAAVHGILLRPLSYAQPGQLYSVRERIPQVSRQFPSLPVNLASFAAWQEHATAFSGFAMAHPESLDLTGRGEPRQILAVNVSASLFPLLGVRPRLGRGFLPSEDVHGRNDVVVLSDQFWHTQFGADPNVLGRTLNLSGHLCRVVGVLPPDFRFLEGAEFGPLVASAAEAGPAQVYRPIGLDPTGETVLGRFDYTVIARLRPDVAPAQGRAQLDQIVAGLVAAAHQPGFTVVTLLTPLLDQFVGPVRRNLWLLLAAVAALLLLIALNLANLVLVRASARAHQTAIQLALGASRRRLAAGLVIEGLWLGLLGALAGLGLAALALGALLRAALGDLPRLDQIRLDGATVALGLGLGLLCGFLCSLIPALRSAGVAALGALDPRRSRLGGGRGGRDLLVGLEAALATLLLVVAGLLLHSFQRLTAVAPGYAPAPRLIMGFELAGAAPARLAAWNALVPRLAALPGVRAVGLSSEVPLQGVRTTQQILVPGDTRPEVEQPIAHYQYVGPGYFAAMGIPVIEGREFRGADQPPAGTKRPASAPGPVIVSALTAARVWPNQNPIGKEFRPTPADQLLQVVGVTADVRTDLRSPAGMMVFQPDWDNPGRPLMYAVLAADPGIRDPAALSAAARQTLWSVAPAATIPTVATMPEIEARTVAPERFQLLLVLCFAAGALFLASLGIYAVVTFAVSLRTPEIGIRVALGATPAATFRLVVRQGMLPALAGLAAGLVLAAAGANLLASQIFGLSPRDPLALAFAPLLLALACLAACALPAWRATRLDPLAALRAE